MTILFHMFNSDLFSLFCELLAGVCVGLGLSWQWTDNCLNWFCWMGIAGPLVYSQQQNAGDSQPSQRLELERLLPFVSFTLLLLCADWTEFPLLPFLEVSLPSCNSVTHLCLACHVT